MDDINIKIGSWAQLEKDAQWFYEKMGFKPYSEVFMEADIEHISMVKYK